MRKTIKNRIFTVAFVLIFVIGQIFTGAVSVAKAAENNKIQVSVQVQSFDKVITTGKSSKTNGFEALKEVLDNNNISMVATDGKYGKFISEVNGVKGGMFGGYDGWSYAINRNNSYLDINTGIDAAILENGDKLIFYYGDMGTLTSNKIEYSTMDANVELTISINNTYNDYTTGKLVIQPINDVKAEIDGEAVQIVNNKITIKEGLKIGDHILKLSDFKTTACPKVVADEIKFTIGAKAADVTATDTTGNVDNTKISKAISDATISAASNVTAKGLNTWSAMSLNKLGKKVDATFLNQSMEDIKASGVKDISNTDMEKLIMGLTAAGFTPYNFQGYNLVSELFNRDINTFLINDAVFGIFAYNYANIKEDYKVTKEQLSSIILKSKLSYEVDGDIIVGWTYYGEKVDPDMTGAAINALSEFYNTKPEVKDSIDAAVKTMSILQNESGYSVSQYGLASETTAFVILGLTSVGINPEGEMFTKDKGDLVAALLSFLAKDGGFKHLTEESSSNYTSTEESLRALIAISGYKTSGKYDFYSSDINSKNLPVFAATNTINNDTVKNIDKVEVDKLPATGAFVDTNLLIMLGLIFIILGAVYTRKVKSEK